MEVDRTKKDFLILAVSAFAVVLFLFFFIIFNKSALDNKTSVGMKEKVFEKTDVQTVDTQTSEHLASGKYSLSKNKNHVFIDSWIFEGADPETFEFICYSRDMDVYAKDKNNFYMNQNVWDGISMEDFKFEEVGSEFCDLEFEHYDVGYIKKSGKVYFKKPWGGISVLDGVNANEFVAVHKKYGKTKKDIYYWEKEINDIFGHLCFSCKGFDSFNFDIETFQVWGDEGYFFGDKNDVYVRLGHESVYKILEVDPASFVYVGGYYSKDKNNAYLYDNKIPDVHLETFEIIRAKDGTIPYFEVVAIDKSNVYMDGEIIDGADPQTFEIISEGSKMACSFTKDKNNVYVCGLLLENVDSQSFELVDAYNEFFKDKNQVYMYGWIFEGADPETFEFICYSRNNNLDIYTKDKNNFYVKDNVLEDVTLENFKFEKEGSIFCNLES